MKNIEFVKLCGAGNDFIIIDNREFSVSKEEEKVFVEKHCKRKYGIGADGVMFVENSEKADFKMRIFNPDGAEVSMCGNGARCIALFAYTNKIAEKKMCFETLAGNISAEILDENIVKLKMSEPQKLTNSIFFIFLLLFLSGIGHSGDRYLNYLSI